MVQALVKGGNRFSGELQMPPDKSISHRSIFFASLGQGESVIRGYCPGEDVRRTENAFRCLGVNMSEAGPGVLKVMGRGLGGLKEPDNVIDAGNSGTTARLLLGVLAGQPFFSVLTGDDSLRRRPMKRVITPLQRMGAHLWGRDNLQRLPVSIRGSSLKGIDYELPVASAQVKSCILLAGLYAKNKTTVIEKTGTRDHTERMMEFLNLKIERRPEMITLEPGIQWGGREYFLPGDISSAAFFLVGALICPGSRLLIRNTGINPTRTGIIEVLRSMGGKIKISNRKKYNNEPVGDIEVEHSELTGVEVPAGLVPSLIDEIPVLTVAAAFAKGKTRISGVNELKHKESDRIEALRSELSKFGVCIRTTEDSILLEGNGRLHAASCWSYRDHRIGMALVMLALNVEGESVIEGIEACSVSFPGFIETTKKVLAKPGNIKIKGR